MSELISKPMHRSGLKHSGTIKMAKVSRTVLPAFNEHKQQIYIYALS